MNAAIVDVTGGLLNPVGLLHGAALLGKALDSTGSLEPGEKTNLHHSFPMFMGGASSQKLTPMSASEHVSLHKDLTSFLKSKHPEMMTKAGYSGAKMQQIVPFKARLAAMKEFYEGPGAKYQDAAKDFMKQYEDLSK